MNSSQKCVDNTCSIISWTVVWYEVANIRVKPFELGPFQVKPRPCPNHTHFRQGLKLKKEKQLGEFELHPVKKEGFNSK
jgi:hypothetical protein